MRLRTYPDLASCFVCGDGVRLVNMRRLYLTTEKSVKQVYRLVLLACFTNRIAIDEAPC